MKALLVEEVIQKNVNEYNDPAYHSPWETWKDAANYLKGILDRDPSLTLDELVRQCRGWVSKMSEESRNNFLHAVHKLEMSEQVNEELLKRDKFEFEIDYGIDSTVHSEERKRRIDNDGSEITDEEITQDIESALDEITHDMMFDKLNIGDKIIIKNEATKLNIVTQLQSRELSNVILFKIVTVMRKENFWINRDTKKVIKV